MGAGPPTVTRPTRTAMVLRRGWLMANYCGRLATGRVAAAAWQLRAPGRHLPAPVLPQPARRCSRCAGPARLPASATVTLRLAADDARRRRRCARSRWSRDGRHVVALAAGQGVDERLLGVELAIRVRVLEAVVEQPAEGLGIGIHAGLRSARARRRAARRRVRHRSRSDAARRAQHCRDCKQGSGSRDAARFHRSLAGPSGKGLL